MGSFENVTNHICMIIIVMCLHEIHKYINYSTHRPQYRNEKWLAAHNILILGLSMTCLQSKSPFDISGEHLRIGQLDRVIPHRLKVAQVNMKKVSRKHAVLFLLKSIL